MKISLEWQDIFNTGVEDIDYQHKYFLRLIKRFSELTEKKLDDKYLLRMLEEISNYGVFHFCSEENLMMKYNYPQINEHIKLHQELITQLYDEMKSIENKPESIIRLIAFLANWFMHHTVEEDQKFANYLRKNDIKTK